MNEDAHRSRRAFTLRRLGGVVVVLAGIGLFVAACGGNSGGPGVASTSSTPSPSGSSSSGAYASALAFSQCMRTHGIADFPDPTSSGGPRIPDSVENSPGYGAAVNACEQVAPPPPGGKAGQTITARQQQDYLRAAACMRTHGIASFPDPTFSGGHVSFDIPSSINDHSTRFARALHTCQKLIPAGLPYSGSGQ